MLSTSTETVTFDGAPPAGTINLGIGQPSADLLPVDLVQKASDAFFASAEPLELNYGVTAGDERFRNALASFLSAGYGAPANASELFVTGGNSQALDLVALTFARPGDTVFVEEPSYFLAFQILRDHGLNIVGIPIDEDGVSVADLKAALKKYDPAFLYTIPSYHNPGGQSTSASRRREIVALAKAHDFVVVADEVYQLLHFVNDPPPAYGTMTDSGQVVSMGSFSKILAPAMRLGWIQTSRNRCQQLSANGFINSGGSINHFSSLIVRKIIADGSLADHILTLRATYQRRAAAMHAALQQHFSSLATWTQPDGGYFFWLRFAADIDTGSLRETARESEVGFQPGQVFSSSGGLNNCLRLSFAHYVEDDIREGVARLRGLFP